MQYKDTLQLFDELVATGVPDAQARIQAQQLGSMGNYIGDVISSVNEKLDKLEIDLSEIRKDLSWMRIIGAAMTVAFFSNILLVGLK